MALRNPIQGLKVSAENLRRLINGQDPMSLEEIKPEPWDGPAFDKFADSGYTAEAGMCLNVDDTLALQERLEAVGLSSLNN